MSGTISGSRNTQSGSSATQNDIPEWLKAGYQTNLSGAQETASTPFQAYGGTMSAGDNDYLAAARDQAAASSRMGLGQLGGASDIYSQIAGMNLTPVKAQQLAGTDLSAYTNPYQSAVIDQSNAQIDRSRQQAQVQNQAAAAAAGSFGGSRHGIVDGENNRNYAQLESNNTNTLLNQGYDRATGLASQDVDRRTNADQFNSGLQQQDIANRFGAASGLSGIANAYQQRAAASQSALQQAGSQLQGTQQSGLDAAYNEFLRGAQDPYQKQDLLNSALFGINQSGLTSSTGSSKGRSSGVSASASGSYGGK